MANSLVADLSGREKMFKQTLVFAVVLILALGVVALGGSKKPPSMAGSWVVDVHDSDAQLTTDGTTDNGRTRIKLTLGFGRINGIVKFDDGDPAKSSVDFAIYPATSISPPISEAGQFLSYWLANLSNQTLVCFHSKNLVRRPDGRLQTTGNLTLTRVDRPVELTPNEAYAGPVYGPPVIHRVSREATFVFDIPASDEKGQKDSSIRASASTRVFREDFPQLVRTVVSTYWPPVVQDENCQVADPGEGYSGSRCTGTFLQSPKLPEVPGIHTGEDYPGPENFNTLVGNHLNILLHLRLQPKGSGEQAVSGN